MKSDTGTNMIHTVRPLISGFIVLTPVLAHTPRSSSSSRDVYYIHLKPENVVSNVVFKYSGAGLDAPKVKPVNTTTFNWWYFDAVSSDLASGDLSSVVVNFFDATGRGFEALSNTKTKVSQAISENHGMLW